MLIVWGATLVVALCATLLGSPVVPLGLNLLVPLTPAWVALAAWGLLQVWNRLEFQNVWVLRASRFLVFGVCCGICVEGHWAAKSAEPMPGAYANLLGLGTKYFLAQGNDPTGELAVPCYVLQDLVNTKERDVVGYPNAKALQRLVGLLPGEQKLKIREGGAFPVFQVYAPVSPRDELLPPWTQTPESGWAVDVDGWPMFRYWR